MTRLVVPIDVAALAVGPQANPAPDGTGYMPPMTQFDQLPYDPNGEQRPFVSEHALAQPFAGGTRVPLPGVHVHWAMPDALTRATAVTAPGGTTTTAQQFPGLPDRWLVTRIALTDGKPGKVRTWVVDSRFVSPAVSAATCNMGSNAVPWQDPNDTTGNSQPYRFLGRAVPLEQWAGAPHDPAAYSDTLDVTRFGMVELAAYYPNAVNVFGLHDPLDDLGSPASVELCYAVTGWHTRAADDPLAGKSADDTAKALATRRWSANDPGPFDATAYCGCVFAVTWRSDLEPAAPAPLTATFGNNTTETLSALIAHAAPPNVAAAANTDLDQIEFQLHTLLTGQLALLADPAGPRLVTRQLHQQRFSPVPFGTQWFVRRTSDGADVSTELVAAVGAQLDALNAQQEEADNQRSVIAGQQWQLYADWYKFLLISYPPLDPNSSGPPPAIQSEQAMQYLLGMRLPPLEGGIAEYNTKTANIDRARAALQAALASGPLGSTCKLASKPARVFYRPADPTLLLSGTDVAPALRYGGDHLASADGLLACRVERTLVSALSAPAVAGAAAASLASGDLAAVAIPPGPQLDAAPLAEAFAREAALLWPDLVAALLAAKAGGGIGAWQAWAQQAIAAFLAVSPQASGFNGTPPSSVGFELWQANPWLPIVMHWQLAYWPNHQIPADDSTQTFAPDLILSRLDAGTNDSLDDDNVDLVLAGTPGADQSTYQGITFITPHAGYAVLKQLTDYAASNRTSPLAQLATAATTMPLLSQSLAGLHDRFLLRRRGLQLDIRDPFAQGENEAQLVTRVRAALSALDGQASTMAPMPEDAFCPVRGGMLGLTLLRLVDAFGQYREYTLGPGANAVLPARSLAPARMFAGTASAPAYAPPRLSQPASVNVAWLAADDSGPIGARTTSNPICGWAVPNYLDESLMIYDPDGTALGSITSSATLPWTGAPSNATTFAQSAATVLANRNPHLRGFVMALLARGPDYLVSFLDAINNASSTIQPLGQGQSAQLPVLVGQPLALVRARVSLAVSGGVAINNTWDAFLRDMNDSTGARTTNGAENVNFPVLLGSVDDPDDGLIGFYLDETDPFGTFHAVGPGSGPVPARKIDTVALSIAKGQVDLTMLVDPRCQIHATTGYQPVQSLAIPATMFKDAFSRMAVTFLTAPVLVERPAAGAAPVMTLPIPLQGLQKGTWSWASVTADANGTQTPASAPVTPLGTGQDFTGATRVLRDGWLSLSGFEE